MLHREQGPGFVRLGHNLIIALEVPAGGPICNLPVPALRFGARTRSSKDNRSRPTEVMNGRDPDEVLVFELLSVYGVSGQNRHRRSDCNRPSKVVEGWPTTWTESSVNTAPFHRIAGSRASHEASGTAAGWRQTDSLQGPRLKSWAVASDIGCSRQPSRGVTI